jgi:PAS domain S-box-containing protein
VRENLLDELKRHVRFGPEDEQALRELGPVVEPSFRAIANDFYDRLYNHEPARVVFTGPEQVERLKGTLCNWMAELFAGPWDEEYFEKRSRIGRVHVRIGLPQRYMFGAMTVIRLWFEDILHDHFANDLDGMRRARRAIDRILDLELAMMMETFGEAFVERMQQLERQERDLLAERLAISEARYDEIVEKGEALIVTAERDGRILLFNSRCEALTGISRADAGSRTFEEIFGAHADREALRARQAQAVKGRSSPPIEIAIDSPARGERWLRWHFTTLPGASGPLVCAIGIDVTDERALGQRTARVERLAALGTMAAGLAHEIRNPLNAAQLQLTLLQRRLGRGDAASEPAASAAALAAVEIRRLGSLVEEFLQFARPQPLRLAHADIRATIDAVVSLVAPEAATAGVELRVIPGDPVSATVDEEKIKQVLFNLIRNGLEAAGQGGRIRIEARGDKTAATVEVSDDGPGFRPGDPIFEPFFTTKEGGTGLGLAIVHRIVTDHGGRIDANRRGGWTVFTISLPPG